MTGTGIFTPETWGMAFAIILVVCAVLGFLDAWFGNED